MSVDWIPAQWPAPDNIVAGTTLRNGSLQSCGPPGDPCWLNQVHGARVVAAKTYDAPPDADASVSTEPRRICVVGTADCLPVLFCARDGSEVAAAHAGWRGLAAGVLEATIHALRHGPEDMMAWLGPAISQPAFEVGDEVRAAFVADDPGAAVCFTANSRGRWQADLYALARRRLSAAGVHAVSGGGFCTFTDRTRFFSYRRNPECGRMISFVAPKNLEN